MTTPSQMITDYFQYGAKEIDYLSRKDKRMAELIKQAGEIRRPVIPDLFTALIHSIVGQQISTKAHTTVWGRLEEKVRSIDPESILAIPEDELQGIGLSHRKVCYIRSIAEQVLQKELDLGALAHQPDDEVVRVLTRLGGVGVWTAEMLLIHSLQRPNVLSYGDLGIRRGLMLLYHHRELPRVRFERYRRRYAPYGTVASIYLWALSSGEVSLAIPML